LPSLVLDTIALTDEPGISNSYISTYIGRPLSVMDSDYDTPLPDDDAEDMEILYLRTQTPTSRAPRVCVSNSLRYVPAASRIISCFRSRAVLSRILAAVMHKVYSIRPTWSRITEAANLEARLDKWYYDLPDYLQYDCHSKSPIPAPHILTLHLDYWCTVLLLHRPL
jgi:Fungal specific transcription factor domain